MGLGLKLQNELPLRDNVLLARYAEARGLDSVWTSEYRSEAVIPMAAYAAATERVTVGSSIIPLYTRSIPALATTAAGLEALAPGRVVLGLGTSSPVIVERWHGVPRARPLRAMAEHVAALKRLL
ncbi:MAG TPA: LLM class flavin-dependent oxidoreductase, partial [Solirubrobacterales bacterium]